MARGRRHDVLALPDLPAAPQRPVHPDEARRDVAERAGQAVLLGQERLLSGQDGGEVGHALSVLQDGQVDRRPAGRDALGQEIGPVLRAEEGGEVVLHVLLGRENRSLIGEQELLEVRVLHADVVRDLAVVEDVPLHGGADLDLPAAPAEHVAEPERPQIGREEDQLADQGEGGEEVGLGHSDLGRLGDRLELGAADVGPAAQQIGRDADDDLRRRDRDRGRAVQQITEVVRGHAEQHGESIPRLASLRLEGRQRRLGVQEHGPGLLQVELGHGAVLEPGLDDLQGLLLDVDVLLGDADALLGGPERDVVVGHVRGQGDEGVVVVREGREQAGVGRLDPAPDPSPEVELPARLRPDRRLPVLDAAAALKESGGGGSIARAVVLDGPDRLLRLREDLADRDAQLGAGLKDPYPGLLEREVVPTKLGDTETLGRW